MNFYSLFEAVSHVDDTGFPLTSFKELYHVGAFDISQRQTHNYEGDGLSVSTEPEAWIRINRGGTSGDTWRLTKSGNKFLDWHEMTDAHHAVINEWAVDNGYAESSTVYHVTWFDDEADEERFSEFSTLSAAEEFADEDETEDPYYKVSKHENEITATTKLEKRMGAKTGQLFSVAYVEDVLDLDGVYWYDLLDVANLSAPRGVIVPSKVDSWKREKRV